VEEEAGRGGRAPAALVALDQFADGWSIDELRDVLGLTHSAAVRLVDGLAADGHVTRQRRLADGRSIALTLTASGRATAERVSQARRSAIEAALANLSPADRLSLEALSSRLTADATELRLLERRQGVLTRRGWLCRLCDLEACGRPRGRCPAAAAARRAAEAAGQPG
jgi:DNA-binding MarR family transcriptional regulator